MRTAFLLSALVTLAACDQEYNISSDPDAYGKPNPAVLETPKRTDRVLQITSPEVDVLWVVDNSCSMSEEQEAIASNFPQFMEYFLDSSLDYHIGVVSTDMDDPQQSGLLRPAGGGMRWIDTETDDALARFREMSRLGTDGSADEKGRAAAFTALELRAENDGFLRGEKAGLHIIVVSDEDDYSGANPITINEFVEYLLNLKEDPELVTFSSVVGPPTGCGGGGIFDEAEPGDDYFAITEQVGGVMHSICTEDWSRTLDDLGLLASGLKQEFFLAELPVPGTIEVTVIDQGADFELQEGRDWDYNEGRNSITLTDYTPPPLAQIEITYELLKGQQP